MPEPSSMDGFMRLPEGGAEEGRVPRTRTADAWWIGGSRTGLFGECYTPRHMAVAILRLPDYR